MTSRLLHELGHRVTTAESGQRGLELFRKQPGDVDVVVLDLTMPERSGEEVLDDLRLVRGDIPVVITSGFQATDASKLMGVSNVIGFLDKPHTLANLEHFQAYGSGFYAGVFVDDEGANSRRGITIKDEADSSTTGTWSTTGTVTAFARDYRSSPAGTGQQTGSASHCGDR